MGRLRNGLTALILIITCILMTVPLGAQEASQDEQNLVEAARVMRATGRVQFNFNELDVIEFMRFMSELLGESIVISPTVKGKVSVMSPSAVSLEEARQIMIATLEMNRLTILDMGKYSKVVPLKEGPSRENIARRGRTGPGLGEEVVAQVLPLDFVTADFIQKAIQQVSGKNVAVLPIGKGDEILLSGKSTDVQRAVSLVHALDVPESIRMMRAIKLKYASPQILAKHLAILAKDKTGPFRGLVAVADDASRKVIVVGERYAIKQAQKVVADLDIPPHSGNFHVYRLQNADAQETADQLSKILAVAARLQASKEGKMPTTVVANIPTNSLVFAAPEEQYQALCDIIEQLDTLPKQVLLRGLIAEVNLTNLKNSGIDWATWGGQVAGNTVYAATAELGGAGVPGTFVDWFRDLSTTEETVTDKDGNNIGTITKNDGNALVYAYIQLLKKFDAINVLSMPRLMCTDNKESSLQVGQVIPQLKASTSDISNPSSIQNSYEYKDTGLILKVTPHVRSGNLVSLEIEQTTEDVLTAMTSDTPVTAKREIKTTVQVANGETVILGGLIKEAEKSMKQRVPGLSYIPLIGGLFKKTVKQHEKLDLMVFLTPYILETPQQASCFSREVVVSGDHGMSEGESYYQKRLETMYDDVVRQQDR